MKYNKYIGLTLLAVSLFSFLYSFALVSRKILEIWIDNVWMIPIFLFGSTSLPYVVYAVRAYGDVLWKSVVSKRTKQKYHGILEEHVYQSIVLPSDCDIFNHMNNSRYSREADFARTRFYLDTGLLSYFRKIRECWIMTGNVARYRRSLEVFQRFNITTKVIHWDDRNIYLRHKFLTTVRDSVFVNAVVMTQMRVMDGTGAENFLRKFFNASGAELPIKPLETDELRQFLNYIESSRNSLKKDL